jgi:hypothetical protein
MELIFADVQGRLWKGIEDDPTDFNAELDRFWDEIVDESEFSLSLWKSEENAYISIYISYEDYVTRLVGLGKGTDQYKLSETFQNDFASVFGLPMLKTCWANEPARIARLVRNPPSLKLPPSRERYGGQVGGRRRCARLVGRMGREMWIGFLRWLIRGDVCVGSAGAAQVTIETWEQGLDIGIAQ